MKLFGELLIEKKLITVSDLVLALLEQMKSTPSIPEIIITQKLLADDDILMILKEQTTSRSGFVEAAKACNLWNDDLAKKVEKSTLEKRIPLGQILVKMKVIEIEVLTKALDEYLGNAELPVAPPAVSIAAEASPASGGGDYSVFTDLYSQEGSKVAKLFESQGAISADNLKAAASEIHKLKGAARLVDLMVLGKILTHAEEILNEALRLGLDKLDGDLQSKLATNLQSLFQRVGMVSEQLANSPSEEAALSKLGDKLVAQEWEDSLLLLKFDLGLSIS